MVPQDSASDLDQLELSGAKATTSFSQYPEYKDSGLEWLGPVPKHWVYGRTDRYLAYRKEQVSPDDLREEVVAYYSIPNFQAYGTYALEEPQNINSDKLRINGGELLVSKLNPRKNSVMLTEPCEYTSICSTEFVPMLPERVDPRYALYFYKSEYVRQTLDARVESVTRSHQRADPDQILKIWTCFPPLDEQRAIAAFLDRETVKIDALIEKKLILLKKLREWEQRTLFDAVNFEAEKAGECWPVLSVVNPGKPVMYGIVLPGPHAPKGVPIIKGGDVEAGRLEPSLLSRTEVSIDARHSKSKVAEGDLIYAIRGSVGACRVVPSALSGANLTQDVARISPGRDVTTEWLYLCLRSYFAFGQVEPRILGATIKGINIRDLERVRIPVPSIGRQREVADRVGRELRARQQLNDRLRAQIAHLREYRTALISAAVTGQIDVRGRV